MNVDYFQEYLHLLLQAPGDNTDSEPLLPKFSVYGFNHHPGSLKESWFTYSQGEVFPAVSNTKDFDINSFFII